MKGNFSKMQHASSHNFNGILPQQGKVLLDSDGIAQTLIGNHWQQQAARDWVGTVAAVPAADPNSFKITAATVTAGQATLTIDTGHLWADGLLARLEDHGAVDVTRTASWLEPPLVATAGSAADVTDGGRDAVVLEVWQHAVNGFQMPELLIEPALGGPDTAERLQTAFAFRLARLDGGQHCADLTFDENGRGALTASLVPPVVIAGDCPVDGSGGYSGFEHQLYRIEIADGAGASQFKWSRNNAGLVGRGSFDPATQSIAITANLAAITGANQTGFYLEIEVYDAALGFSRVLAGAPATLSGSSLQCAAVATFGAYPATAGTVFFRLWDGISPVSAFPVSAAPIQLESGILLQFDAGGPGKYFPGDYWLFPVRAQGIANPQTLIDARKPEGIRYHRVALAEITWAAAGGGFAAASIEDCRVIFTPLTQRSGCCTVTVGDGIESFGEFTSINAAIDALPPLGGEVCILPGRYFEHVRITGRDIVLHGCGWQTRIASPALAPGYLAPVQLAAAKFNDFDAVITIGNAQHIALRSFAVEAAQGEVGILIDGVAAARNDPALAQEVAFTEQGAIDITLQDLVLTASNLPAILAERVALLFIRNSRIAMANTRSSWPAIFVSGREIHIEKNWVGIQTPASLREWLPATVLSDLRADGKIPEATEIALHPGGIQISGPAQDVYILENEIEGGGRNGITLGGFAELDANGGFTGKWVGVTVIEEGGDCCPATLQPGGGDTSGGGTLVSRGLLINIQIHRNRIADTGLCGIGPAGFFNLLETLEVISIEGLNISSNAITRTVRRETARHEAAFDAFMGYGAICVPDVSGLIIRDNSITDFGAEPGAAVCGIYLLHGQMIEISRNHVLESRDWSKAEAVSEAAATGARGGIVVMLGTPPSITVASYLRDFAQPIYEPGVPALRVEHNTARVPLGQSLMALGIGPFAINNNHFSCGGMVSAEKTLTAQTVLILNFGTSLENADAASPSGVYNQASSGKMAFSDGNALAGTAGTVLFSNNICQLEARFLRGSESASVLIYTPDHLIFSNNQCWLEGMRFIAIMDAMLVGGSLNVLGNRFQEGPGAVQISGITAGPVNITSQNISTYCLLAFGAVMIDVHNIVIVSGTSTTYCTGLHSMIVGGK